MLKSLSPIDVALIKKIGGNGSSYTLPIASPTVLGGVQPVAKTDAMTQSVGVDANGGLWTAEVSGVGGNPWTHIIDFTLEEDVSELLITQDAAGNTFEYDELFAQMIFEASANNTEQKSVEIRFLFDKITGRRSPAYELPYAQRTKGAVMHTSFCAINPFRENNNAAIFVSFQNSKLDNFTVTFKKLSGVRLWPYTQYIGAGTFIKLYGRNRT